VGEKKAGQGGIAEAIQRRRENRVHEDGQEKQG
jgi:hypothetical protein